MRLRFFTIILFSVLGTVKMNAQKSPEAIREGQSSIRTDEQKNAVAVQLPNGWSLTPAGTSVALSNDLPLNMAVSPDKQFVAVANNGGGNEGVDLIDLKTNKRVHEVTMKKAWLGLAFERSRPYLYASGADDNIVIRLKLEDQKLVIKDTLKLGAPFPNERINPSGLCIDEKSNRLYVVTRGNHSLYVCDTRTMKVLSRLSLSTEAYTCIFNAKKKELYISAWGGKKVLIYDPKKNILTDSVNVEENPNDLVISRDGKWLFVANSNSNSVSVVNTSTHRVVETLNAALYPDALIGSTTNALALSEDDKTLYVANADNNCLAVFDVSNPGNSAAKGFIPTGWFPTGVKVLGQKILVLNGMGMTSYVKTKEFSADFKWGFRGTMSIIDVPDKPQLNRYSKQVYTNTPYSLNKEAAPEGEQGNPIPLKEGGASPIKYVFYVIKENQTYDNILGDLPQGNGDPNLCLFGRKITPNAHAISEQFVLYDNFYVQGEVSVDGHHWLSGAYASDYVEKQWPYDYSGRGGGHLFDSSDSIANPPQGFLWDYAHRAGVTFRNYGQFMGWQGEGGLSLGHGLLRKPENYCHQFPGWDMSIQDVYREKTWEHDFDSLVSINAMRQLNIVYFPQDHTSGQEKGAYTPTAHVADNDLALGRLVEHISHSPIWAQSAIFVLEDDPGGRWDHVDLHRSVAYVISPYAKRGYVDHTMYSTSSMLRTIELILGLPPMSQFDASATPMWRSFTPTSDLKPYTALIPETNIDQRNTAVNKSSKLSETFNLKRPDAVPDKLIGEVVWKSVKGENSVMPAPKRSAFVKYSEEEKEDDEDELEKK